MVTCLVASFLATAACFGASFCGSQAVEVRLSGCRLGDLELLRRFENLPACVVHGVSLTGSGFTVSASRSGSL